MRTVVQEGVRVAVEDIGTNTSPFVYLQGGIVYSLHEQLHENIENELVDLQALIESGDKDWETLNRIAETARNINEYAVAARSLTEIPEEDLDDD